MSTPLFWPEPKNVRVSMPSAERTDMSDSPWKSYEPPQAQHHQPAMIVLRPGDHVLVALHEDPPPEEAQAWAHALHQAFRGVSFTLVGGVAGIAVQGGTPKR